MKPFVIQWPAATTNTVVSAGVIASGVALTFQTITYIPDSSVSVQGNVPGNLVPIYADSPRYSIIPNLGTGAQKPSFAMPRGNIRNISISAATGSVNAISFAVVGLDQNGDQRTETIIGTGGTVQGTVHFSSIISITPASTSGATVNVGLGIAGYTSLYEADEWNKQNNYTIAYSNVSGTISALPTFTINPIYSMVNGVPTRISTPDQNSTLYYPLQLNNPNVIATPSSASTAPVTVNAAFSVVGIPMSGLFTTVTATTGSFDQTILQQGGLV